MKDCVVLTGDVNDAAQAASWAANCARKARMREVYAKACQALFGGAGGGKTVVLSAEFGKGAPEFQLCTDGAVKCDALGPQCDDEACDGLTCFRLAP